MISSTPAYVDNALSTGKGKPAPGSAPTKTDDFSDIIKRGGVGGGLCNPKKGLCKDFSATPCCQYNLNRHHLNFMITVIIKILIPIITIAFDV